METSHQANIFGVRFLYGSNDRKIVTGAMDYSVQLHELDCNPHTRQTSVRQSTGMRRHPDSGVQGVPVSTTVFSCHQGRVKVSHMLSSELLQI